MLALCGGVMSCGSQQTPAPEQIFPLSPSNVLAHTFAFWYDQWNPTTTPPKVKPADVVIGLAPFNVDKAHRVGKLVLQYQTYYQAFPKTPLLTSMADLTNVGFQINHQVVLNIFGTPNSYVMCPNSKILRQRVQQYVTQAFASGYDGLFVDNTFFDPPAHLVCDATHDHVDSGVLGGRAYLTLLSEVRQTVKAHNPNAILMTNPGDPAWADQMATASPTLWDVSDYVLWESYGYTSYTDSRHDNWNNAIAQSYRLIPTSPEKAAKLVALSYVTNVAEARYAFAVARFFGLNWTANLGASVFGTYLNDIPFKLGNPVEPLPPFGPLLHRVLQNGEVFINTGSVVQAVTVPAGTMYLGAITTPTTASTQITLQPRTAAIVITQ